MVYNGEFYNTPEVRRALEDLDYRFEGHSHTEVRPPISSGLGS